MSKLDCFQLGPFTYSMDPAHVYKLKRPLEENAPSSCPIFLKRDTSKENIPPESAMPDKSSPNKGLLNNKLQHSERKTPKKMKCDVEEPVTPSTNFKMLTSLAATLDYAQCSTPKSSKTDMYDQCMEDNEAVDGAVRYQRVNRKEKSLSIICSRFLEIYPMEPPTDKQIVVSLDVACSTLGVERRRLYDIVNVFESIDMLKKSGKNCYQWYGKRTLMTALQKIKIAALHENILEKLQFVLSAEKNTASEYRQPRMLEDVQDFNKNLEESRNPLMSNEATSAQSEFRKEKSLAIMSQKFLMIFLISQAKVITLGAAAKVLNGFTRNEKSTQIKTQIRRLYDIANVLSSIGLIEKIICVNQNGRKPAFKYVGPVVETCEINAPTTKESIPGASRSLIRHSSFQEICAVAEMEHQKLFVENSANSAPPFESSLGGCGRTPPKTTFKNINLSKTFEQITPTNLSVNSSAKSPVGGDSQLPTASEVLKYLAVKNQATTKSTAATPPSTSQVPSSTSAAKQGSGSPGQYYIVNPVSYGLSKSNTNMGTLLLLTPVQAQKFLRPANQVDSPQDLTIPIVKPIALKPLQLTVKNELSNIENSSKCNLTEENVKKQTQSSSNDQIQSKISIFNPPQRNLADENVKETQISSNIEVQSKISIFNHSQQDVESNESSSSTLCNSQSNSKRYDSPLSLPSGCVTPVLNQISALPFPVISSSDSTFKELVRTPSFSEKSAKSTGALNLKVGKAGKSESPRKSFESVCNSGLMKRIRRSKMALAEAQNSTSNSCSNDSLGGEVSDIFRGRSRKESILRSFLIDEKTRLSPIQSPKCEGKAVTPSPFMTPPFATPESGFLSSPIHSPLAVMM